MRAVLLFVAILVALTSAVAPLPAQNVSSGAPTENPFLWVIKTEPPSFLFGTIHLPDDRVLSLPGVVTIALGASDVVCTEVPMDMATQMKAVQSFMMGEDRKLADVLPPELYQRAEARFEAAGLPLAMFGNFKPIAIAVQLVLLDYFQELMTKKPLDGMLYEMASSSDKKADALETIDEQIAVLDAFSEEEQLQVLAETLDQMDAAEAEGSSVTEKMIQLYLAGDGEGLWKVIYQYTDPNDPIDQKFLRIALTERNERMAARIIERLKRDPDKVYFFAVGAAHYDREDGILARLRAAGYEVYRLRAADAEMVSEMLEASEPAAE